MGKWITKKGKHIYLRDESDMLDDINRGVKAIPKYFGYNSDLYSQKQEVIDAINTGRYGAKNYNQLLNDYRRNPDSDWYIEVIKNAQGDLALRKEKQKSGKIIAYGKYDTSNYPTDGTWKTTRKSRISKYLKMRSK